MRYFACFIDVYLLFNLFSMLLDYYLLWCLRVDDFCFGVCCAPGDGVVAGLCVMASYLIMFGGLDLLYYLVICGFGLRWCFYLQV